MTQQGEPAYEGWAMVEQMGFRKTYCRVREVEQFGTKMLRMDVPIPDQPDGYVTMFAGGPSLYQVTPLSEELARAYAERASDPRPVMPVGFRIEKPRDLLDHGEEHARSVAFQEAGDDGDAQFEDR